uniref:Uncharacterized protein n=1 Tax=Providencia stuartii TaxID=588 RepID=A0AAI9D870_PROST|nr:hypothetical protein [Providencia stuartii]
MAVSSLSVIKLPIKDLGKFFLRVIFFPLIAILMFWKVHMASKKEILEDLARFRAHGDVLYKDLYEVSTTALRLMSNFENRLKQSDSEEDKRLLAEMHQFVDMVITATIHSNEYADSLLKDYGQALKKIGNS